PPPPAPPEPSPTSPAPAHTPLARNCPPARHGSDGSPTARTQTPVMPKMPKMPKMPMTPRMPVMPMPPTERAPTERPRRVLAHAGVSSDEGGRPRGLLAGG